MAFKKLFSRKSKSLSPVAINHAVTDNTNGCFDCNICLDLVSDPVVTLCGHLYCWPCLYEWFNVQRTSLASDEHPQCPVCKAQVTHSTVVPLYGRGETTNQSGPNRDTTKSPTIPPRPPAHGTRELLAATSRPRQSIPSLSPHQRDGRQYYPPYENGIQASSSLPLFNQGGNQSVSVVHPVLEMFAEMIYARVSGNSRHNLYSLQNSYHRAMNPRVRRQEMQANKFLSRISLFFLCCILLCLVFF